MPTYTNHAFTAPSPESDVERLWREILPLPYAVDRPCLAVLSGLPGSGKTTFARKLTARVPLAILESDALRKALFSEPAHSSKESRRLFAAIHRLAHRLLREGISVLLDATNLRESNRAELYNLAERAGVRLFLVRIEAPPETIRKRLERRTIHPDPKEASTADWRVYRRMAAAAEPILPPHVTVNTDEDVSWALDKLAHDMASPGLPAPFTLPSRKQPAPVTQGRHIPAGEPLNLTRRSR